MIRTRAAAFCLPRFRLALMLMMVAAVAAVRFAALVQAQPAGSSAALPTISIVDKFADDFEKRLARDMVGV